MALTDVLLIGGSLISAAVSNKNSKRQAVIEKKRNDINNQIVDIQSNMNYQPTTILDKVQNTERVNKVNELRKEDDKLILSTAKL